MADSSTTIVIDQTDALELGSVDATKDVVGKVANYFQGIIGGNKRVNSVQVFPDGAAPKVAVAHIKLASCAAATVIEVNGVPFTALSGTATVANDEFDISGADAADAAALSAAINNSTTAGVYNLVKAVNPLKDVLTAATAIAGTSFSVTLADGVKHTFIGKAGAATSGGLNFSIDTGDTETATSIAAQVVGYAPFANKLTATSSSAVVTFRSLDGNSFTLVGTATVLAESGGTVVTVSAIQKGGLGNSVTVKSLGVVATATVTYSSSSGNQTVTINGVSTGNVSSGASDTLTATAVKAVIDASTNALVSRHVRVLQRAGVLHIFAKYPGTAGNAITLAASGTGATASATRLGSGTEAQSGGAQATGTLTLTSVANAETCTVNGVTLTAHTNTDANNQFRIDGDDTADAAALARAINNSTTAALADVIATSSTNIVTVTARRGGHSGNAITIAAGQGTIVASGARLTGGATPTAVGLTNTTETTGGAERCSNGTGGAVSVKSITC